MGLLAFSGCAGSSSWDDSSSNDDSKGILTVTKADQSFLDINMSEVKTIKCSALNINDTFTINDDTFIVVDKAGITVLLSEDENNPKLIKVCTSKITDMAGLFGNSPNFNQPIGNWDTSSVITMNGTFYGAEKFNQDLSSWDVSKVTDHTSFFYGTAGGVEPNWQN